MLAVLRTLVLLAVGSAAAMLFIANNDQSVVVYYWLKDASTGPRSLSVVLFYAFLTGFALAALAGIVDQVRLRARLRQSRRTSEKLEAELAALKNLPLVEPYRGDESKSP